MKILKKIWYWIDDRTGISELVAPMMKHLVPPDSKWAYVLGSATLIAFIVQVITGIGLAFMYQPSSGAAYDSLKFISSEAPFGRILRGVHYFGSSTMILLIGLHMIRVYLYGAFKYPREMGWISGVILLGMTVMMGFTGQLLRWDSTGVWSAIVGAAQAGRIPLIGKPMAYLMLGGDTIGGQTLSRIFALHVFLIPGILFAVIGLHIYLVVRNGISEPPKAGRPVDPKTYRKWYHDMLEEKGVPFWPDAAWRDMLFGFLVIIAILLLAVFVGAPPIEDPPDPSNIIASPKPDWYFLWIFGVFALMPRSIEDFALAYAPILVGFFLFAMPFLFNKGERSPWRRPWSIMILLAIITVVSTFWYRGSKSSWSPKFNAQPLPAVVVGDVSQDAKAGSVLFSKKACLYCHTISGNGGQRGPDLSNVADRMNSDELTVKIVNGGVNMPAYGATLTQQELHDLVKFLSTRKHP
jgi:ubiquinol-cytochrome c reductase cytochrome b subunit